MRLRSECSCACFESSWPVRWSPLPWAVGGSRSDERGRQGCAIRRLDCADSASSCVSPAAVGCCPLPSEAGRLASRSASITHQVGQSDAAVSVAEQPQSRLIVSTRREQLRHTIQMALPRIAAVLSASDERLVTTARRQFAEHRLQFVLDQRCNLFIARVPAAVVCSSRRRRILACRRAALEEPGS